MGLSQPICGFVHSIYTKYNYKEISTIKAFTIAESKKQCYFPGGMNNFEDIY